ncbi:transcriptional regulator [Dictyobacter sp. S3.2.2.5]|uniref:Transcriptional regulator n=1 Tax=Dictyobacter halimunensis TaxID=3026934 RepID=A0ABQ6FN79_9CHLR|nr:transcriptional regulator [Dictyobacter sp. S3.2.2.5]
MQRFDRVFGILLFLRSKPSVPASELARHFEVSTRTIYRDLETLSVSGVPLYAQRGRQGGVRLLPGYFLPPLMFTQSEAIALLLGLTLQKSLRAIPFPAEREMAEKKLLAALPDPLRSVLTKAERLVGFEKTPNDIFHPELAQHESPLPSTPQEQPEIPQSRTITIFFQAVLESKRVLMQYASPYRSHASEVLMEPQGLFWDRDRWYLAGNPVKHEQVLRFWRADRVLDIKPLQPMSRVHNDFDVRAHLGRNWLQSAMEQWRQRSPVKIRLSRAQAERLGQDWYYRHAHFEPVAQDQMIMTFGEQDPEIVLELVRWLGPGAELLEPLIWRERMREELRQMLTSYTSQ